MEHSWPNTHCQRVEPLPSSGHCSQHGMPCPKNLSPPRLEIGVSWRLTLTRSWKKIRQSPYGTLRSAPLSKGFLSMTPQILLPGTSLLVWHQAEAVGRLLTIAQALIVTLTFSFPQNCRSMVQQQMLCLSRSLVVLIITLFCHFEVEKSVSGLENYIGIIGDPLRKNP